MTNKLQEAFSAILHKSPSEFKSSVLSALKIKLAEKINGLEEDVVSRRFAYLAEKSAGEARFRALHTIQRHDHPVAPEDTFTSNKKKVGTPNDSPDVDTEEDDPFSTNELMKQTIIRGKV